MEIHDVVRYMPAPMDETVWRPATSDGAAIAPLAPSSPLRDALTWVAPGVFGLSIELSGRLWNVQGGLHSIGDSVLMVVLSAVPLGLSTKFAESAPRAGAVFGGLGMVTAATGVVVYSSGLGAAIVSGLLGLGCAYGNVIAYFNRRGRQREQATTVRTLQQDQLGAMLQHNRDTQNGETTRAWIGVAKVIAGAQESDRRVDDITARLERLYFSAPEPITTVRVERYDPVIPHQRASIESAKAPVDPLAGIWADAETHPVRD